MRSEGANIVDPDLQWQTFDAERILAQRARSDPALFAAFVLRDEETGGPVTSVPMHKEWHALISSYKRTLIWAHVEAGKSQQISIARALYELGRNPQLRIVIISNTHDQAAKIVSSIGKYLEKSRELKMVFPDLAPDKTQIWTKHALTVKRRGAPKDPSVQAIGIHGNILGARIDFLVIDDILDYENALSAHQREDLHRWYMATVTGRMTRQSRAVAVGTAWHVEDILHRFARSRQWYAVRYPVISAQGRLTWPERWSKERIEERKQELHGGPEFSRQLLCVARSDEEARFKQAWIARCLEAGKDREPTYALSFLPPGYRCVTGVDLSSGRVTGDLTALVTVLVHPDETREILWIEAGRWDVHEIQQRILDHAQRYDSELIVENNATQEWMVQLIRGSSAAKVIPFTTGTNVRSPVHGVESIAAEMSNGKWIIPAQGLRPEAAGLTEASAAAAAMARLGDPSMSRELEAARSIEQFIRECLYYDPKAHTGDRLMAAWFAREGARMKKKVGKVRPLNLVAR